MDGASFSVFEISHILFLELTNIRGVLAGFVMFFMLSIAF